MQSGPKKLNIVNRFRPFTAGLWGIAFGAMPTSCQAQAPAPAGAASAFSQVKLGKNGLFSVGGLNASVLHKSFGWAPAYQRDLQPDASYPQVSATSQFIKGTFKTDSGNYQFAQKITPAGPNAVSYTASLTGTPTKETRVLALTVSLPVGDYRGQQVFFDNTANALPWWFKGQALVKGYQPVKRVRVPLKDGRTLAIDGDFEAYLEDNREYGAADLSLQIGFSNHTGSISESHLAATFSLLPAGDVAAVPYNVNAKQPARAVPPAPKPQTFEQDQNLVAAMRAQVKPLPRLLPKGEDFVDATGKKTRFWGMNLVAFYPEHDLADKTADNLASLGINMVRLHHNLRPSRDWAPADMPALVTYEADSRTPNLKAWDHYDYFNAKLRQKNIYLSVSLHGSRSYLPGDVAVLKVSPEDDEAWANAMDDLNHWTWRKAMDPRKMLPVFDERAFLLNAEFAKYFLTKVNPYTGIAYGKDPQIASVELINEFSSEYTLTTGNQFPEYWTAKLNALLKDYAAAHNVAPFTLYAKKTKEQQKCFSEFCNSLDEKYATRMEKVVREAGYEGPILFSNLWRGDANLRMRARRDGIIEDHAYTDPLVVQNPDNFLYSIAKSSVVGKPVIIGEFNQSEDLKVIKEREAAQSMLPAAIAAYGSLHNDAGVLWFAWTHGAFKLTPEGWGKPGTDASNSIGLLAGDQDILDHMRTAGIIFKNGYLSPSVDPQTVYVDDSYAPSGYNDLMRGQTEFKPGWQAVHSFRKAFGPVPAGQAAASWMTAEPANPTVSDTKQIVRDAERQQLSFSAPKAESFSGNLDGKPAANLAVLNVGGESGFATVMVTTLDDTMLTKSRKIVVSRTYHDAKGNEAVNEVSLRGMATGKWSMKVTRPASAPPVTLTVGADGVLKLPATGWHECEIEAQ